MPRKVEDVRVDDRPSLDTLVQRLGAGGGFTAQAFARGVDLLTRILGDPEMTTFLSFPADVVATGTRGVLAYLVSAGYVDAVVTTCGTLDHDLARAYRPYYHGEWMMDDAKLHRRGLYRLGNLVIPQTHYGRPVEREVQRILSGRWKRGLRGISSAELAWAIGEHVGSERGRGSICRAAYERQVPILVPGITDGAVGSQLWMFWQQHHDFTIDLLSDEQRLSDLVFEARRSGAIVLGGGISKHHTIWWNQFREGLDAALYVTSAVEWDGSLSGARTREAVSWGKLKARAPHVTLDGDVTVLFPFMVSAALERLGRPNSRRPRRGRAPRRV